MFLVLGRRGACRSIFLLLFARSEVGEDLCDGLLILQRMHHIAVALPVGVVHWVPALRQKAANEVLRGELKLHAETAR